jgi:hypothetical protein
MPPHSPPPPLDDVFVFIENKKSKVTREFVTSVARERTTLRCGDLATDDSVRFGNVQWWRVRQTVQGIENDVRIARLS